MPSGRPESTTSGVGKDCPFDRTAPDQADHGTTIPVALFPANCHRCLFIPRAAMQKACLLAERPITDGSCAASFVSHTCRSLGWSSSQSHNWMARAALARKRSTGTINNLGERGLVSVPRESQIANPSYLFGGDIFTAANDPHRRR